MAVSKTFQFQSHAVSRTDELLSCAKTAFRIAASASKNTTTTSTSSYTSLDSIQLHNPSFQPQPISDLLEEGLTLLRSMDHDVSTLQTLAKRRGQTNDPTKEIAVLTARLEQDTQELQEFTSQRLLRQPCATKSAQQHLQFVAAWFQQMSKHQSEKLQEVLKLRGTVLRDQAQRRTMVTQQKTKSSINPHGASSTPATTTRGGGGHHQRRVPIKAATPLFDSPLFANTSTNTSTSTNTNTTQVVNRPSAAQTRSVPANNQYYNPSAVPSNGGGGGGGYYSHSTAGAAGGYGLGYGDVGMRNRRQQQGPSSNGSATMQQQQQQQELEQRQIQRQTAQRAREARQAERQIGELGQLFGKMSTLIATQGEVVEQIEEDVEAAHVDIVAGEKELSKLYQLKKGNRPLIIKVYAILIFLICFMRLYKK